jgi:uncharacterized phage infection (PIP) family protein YhgE
MDNLASVPISKPEQNPPLEQQVKTKIETAQEQASKIKREASEQAASTLESAKSNMKEIAEGAVGYGQRALTEQKQKLAEIVQQYGQAAKAVSQNLHRESHDALAERAEEISSRLDRASNYLREREISEIYYDAEHFTRRRPELVFGMMFAAGLLAARFLKASNRGPESSYLSKVGSEQKRNPSSAAPPKKTLT